MAPTRSIVISLLLMLPVAVPAQTTTFLTDFEEENQSTVGTFTIIDGSLAASFAGGTAFTIGNTALYYSGLVSWMIDPAGPSPRGESTGEGVITLSVDARRLAGWVRTENAQALARIQGIDTTGAVVFEQTAVSAEWRDFDHIVPQGAAPVRELRFINDGGGMAALDDFAYQTGAINETDPPPYGGPGGGTTGGTTGGGGGGGGSIALALLAGLLLFGTLRAAGIRPSVSRRHTSVLGIAVVLAGCGGDYRGDAGGDGDDPPDPDALRPTIESIQEHVFSPRCASCHQGLLAPQGLRLDDAQTSYDNLVDVRSMQVPSQFRVEPGNPDGSYLIDKLEGTQAVGDRMPRGQPPLPAETIAVIREWIADGAPPPGFNAKREPFLLPPVEWIAALSGRGS